MSGEVALITGSAGGIGAATARVLGAAGWRTVGLDLVADGGTDLPLVADVTDRQAVEGAVERAVAHFGRLDLVVTAAGVYEDGLPVESITPERWDRMLAVVLGGTVHTCAAALPHLLRGGGGSVVVVSSELAIGGGCGDLHYVAAKGAVIGFAKSLALEVAEAGVRVAVVAPGPTDTPMLAADSPWRDPGYLATLPLGRLVSPDEVAHTVRHLAAEGAMYCGDVLSPNAGAVI